MDINFNSKSNFNAKRINIKDMGTILNYDSQVNKYLPKSVNLVEINPNNKNDIKALLFVACKWIYHLYSGEIAFLGQQIRSNNIDGKFNKIYAITNQKSNFRKLNCDDLLGTMAINLYEPSKVTLDYIQVNTDNIHNIKHREYKHIGSVMVDSLRKKYANKCIRLNPNIDEIGFYEKIGFYKTSDSPLTYEIDPI